ncbi:MAG TPA: hypothetical protein VMO47_12335 [Rhodothermales bacterium]|nr:hypothetical protein [Rhodothermales bacterium]
MYKGCWKIGVALLYVISFVECSRTGAGVPRIPDDPDDEDLTEPSERTRNRMLFGNLTYSV